MADECLPQIVFTHVHGWVAKARSSTRACIVSVEDTNNYSSKRNAWCDLRRVTACPWGSCTAWHDKVAHSSWSLWRPQPKRIIHESQGVQNTVPTKPSQRDTNRQRWASIVSKKIIRGWRSQSSLTSKVLLLWQGCSQTGPKGVLILNLSISRGPSPEL